MKCDRTQKVSLLIDGELPPAEAHEVERHLNLCGDCRAAREDFLLLRRQIADYPLELDAFARQRALKRILAAGGNRTKLEHETPPHRRESFAGAFGMPRLGVAGLAALLLLLVGVGVVSLMSSRRAHVEVVSNEPTPAHANNSNNNSSTAATSITPTPAPHDLTASASRPGGGEQAAGNNQKRAGGESTDGASRNAEGIARAGVNVRRVERARGGVLKSSPTPANSNPSRVESRGAESARNDVEVARGGSVGANDAGDNDATRRDAEAAERADTAAGSKTARHVEQAQLLLRSFRNARPADAGRRASSDLAHEKRRSKKLLYQNIVLRREAASRGNLPVESLLDSLEPILIDIANLPDRPAPADVREINERMRRKNLVAMLQISAVESASARSY
ncbi:MAG TPA: zf-HC2 domain-containing protein [Pyrinomonadaceae bacterium]